MSMKLYNMRKEYYTREETERLFELHNEELSKTMYETFKEEIKTSEKKLCTLTLLHTAIDAITIAFVILYNIFN